MSYWYAFGVHILPTAGTPHHVLPHQPGGPLPDGAGAAPAHCPAGSAVHRALVRVAAADALDLLGNKKTPGDVWLARHRALVLPLSPEIPGSAVRFDGDYSAVDAA